MDLNHFLNLFASPGALAQQQRQRQVEEQLATAQSLQDLLVGNQQQLDPNALFVDNPLGGAPISGNVAGRAGILPESPQRDFISTLLQSGSPQIAQQGTQLTQQALAQQALQQQQRGESDIAAKARKALEDTRRRAVTGLQGRAELSPGQQFLSDIFAGGGPSSGEAFKSLAGQFDPFTLSAGQTRFGPFGNQIARVGVAPVNKTDAQTKLRKEFQSVTEAFSVSDDSMGKIKSLGVVLNPTPATDNSLLFQYASLLSPGIVTSDDFENAKKSGTEGWAGQVRALASQMINGKLPDDVRRNIINAAAVQFKGESDIFTARKQDYTDLAIQNKLDSSQVTGLRKIRTDITDLLSPPPPTGFRRP